jgi:hypothetical protein
MTIEKEKIKSGTFGKVPIEAIEIHPVLAEFFMMDGMRWLAKHPFTESVTRAAVEVSKLPVVLKRDKSKVQKYLLTGNLDIYFAALSLADDPMHSHVTVVVDEKVNEAAMVNNAIHRLLVPIHSPISNAIQAATHLAVEKRKQDKGFRYSISSYESDLEDLEKHSHFKKITGFDSRAWNKVKLKCDLSPEMIKFIDQIMGGDKPKDKINQKNDMENVDDED